MLLRTSTACVKLMMVVLLAGAFAAYAADEKAEDIVAHHLASIGTPDALAAVKSRAVQGTLKFHIQVGGGADTSGTWGRVSQQRASNFVMRFAAGGDWRGEQFVFDGQKTSYATATASHTRSVLAQYVSSQDFMVKDGLLGGELSTAWALENLDQTHAKLQVLGRKKIDGQELIGVQYFAKNGGDTQVKIYFDPETYHHVMTVYTTEFSPNMNGDITQSVYQHENRYTIEERFSDFETVDGLTLPKHYHLEYTQEVQSKTGGEEGLLGTTRVYDWDMTVDRLLNNVSLDPANFKVK